MRKTILISAALAPLICLSTHAAPKPVKTPEGDVIQTPDPVSRFYGSTEYLLWWVKGAPLSVPLVSSGSTSFKEGFLVNSSATVLYGAPYSPAKGGNDTQNFPAFSGTRLTLGYWLDDKQGVGIELSGFLLENQAAGFQAFGDRNGDYPAGNTSSGMRIPVYSNVPYAPGGRSDPENGATRVPAGEDGVPLALPGDVGGGVVISNTLQLWGVNATAVIKFHQTPNWELSGLAGFRYLDLSEALDLNATLNGIPTSMLYHGQSGTVSDHFQTRNQFFGADLGLRGRYTWQRLSCEFTGRVALGVSHDTENIAGSYQDSNSGFASTSGPYGIFAMPANSGRTSVNKFAVVPEAQFKIGYAITPRLLATVSYDFLYYSNVLRPGDQINRSIPKGQTFQQDGTAASTTSPVRLSRATDFFAHGVSFGLEFKF